MPGPGQTGSVAHCPGSIPAAQGAVCQTQSKYNRLAAAAALAAAATGGAGSGGDVAARAVAVSLLLGLAPVASASPHHLATASYIVVFSTAIWCHHIVSFRSTVLLNLPLFQYAPRKHECMKPPCPLPLRSFRYCLCSGIS